MTAISKNDDFFFVLQWPNAFFFGDGVADCRGKVLLFILCAFTIKVCLSIYQLHLLPHLLPRVCIRTLAASMLFIDYALLVEWTVEHALDVGV